MKIIKYIIILAAFSLSPNIFCSMVKKTSFTMSERSALQELGFSLAQIKQGVSEAQIREAYKKMALQWHPDRNANKELATARMKKINEAYELLTKGSGGGAGGKDPLLGGGKDPLLLGDKEKEPEKKETDPGKKTTDEELNKKYSEIIKETGEGLGGAGTGVKGLIENIIGLVATSLCKSRSFTIMPNMITTGEKAGEQAPGFILLTHQR